MFPQLSKDSAAAINCRILFVFFGAIAIVNVLSPEVGSAQPESKQDSPSATTEKQNMPPAKSYLGIGGTIGLTGNTSSLGTGGFSILSKTVLNDFLAIHGNNVVFGSATASSSNALTLNFPIRGSNSQDIMISPFIGGGIQIRNDGGTFVSPLVVGGVDIPISKSLTGTVRVETAFPNTGKADVGIAVGIGYSFF